MVTVVVRGTDNRIYSNTWDGSSDTGPGSANWYSEGGATTDTPACAYVSGKVIIVVRGTNNNQLYWRTSGEAPGWQTLYGQAKSTPVLVSIPWQDTVELFVQGMDNRIYQNQYSVAGGWSSTWHPNIYGKSAGSPAAAVRLAIRCNPGCAEYDDVIVVVRGMDNHVYWTYYHAIGPGSLGWAYGWASLSGTTFSPPTLSYHYYLTSCNSATTHDCTTFVALAVRGADNKVYHKTFGLTGDVWSTWDSPGGLIYNRPALAAYIASGYLPACVLLVQGTNGRLYANTFEGTWGTWSYVSGATNSDPALAAIL